MDRSVSQTYKLSATLSGHSSDVRSVASPANTLVLSASYDSYSIEWAKNRSSWTSNTRSHGSIVSGSSKVKPWFVTSIAYLKPTAASPKGCVITGCQDMIIRLFDLDSAQGVSPQLLVGHSANVCALHALDDILISGSWDKTAKVWEIAPNRKDHKLVYTLRNREHPEPKDPKKGPLHSVWAVLALGGNQYLTGSADNHIILWEGDVPSRSFVGHTAAVRGLALMPDIGFVSCSNDSTVKIWTLDGTCVQNLTNGHTHFVFSVAVLHNGDIVSSGELRGDSASDFDMSVCIWRDGALHGKIDHPAASVWSVSSMPNGDIVTGSNDGNVRIFSESEERWATPEDRKTYEAAVMAVKTTVASSSTKKKVFEGKEYDFVFDVDIQEGATPLKLPYNRGEPVFEVAQRFLDRHNLPLTYLDEVVRFIDQNAGTDKSSSQSSQYVDPYTGASRYQASSTSVPNGNYDDPFTGASRYQSSSGSVARHNPNDTYVDPYTGASRYSGSASAQREVTHGPQPPPPPAVGILPMRNVEMMKNANIQMMQKKLDEYDDLLRRETDTIHVQSALSPEERNLINKCTTFIKAALDSGITSPSSVVPFPDSSIEHLTRILDRWPRAYTVPVFDLIRLMVAFTSVFDLPSQDRDAFLNAIMKASGWNDIAWSKPMNNEKKSGTTLLFRTLTNLFGNDVDLGDGSFAKQIFESVGDVPYVLLDKAQRTALTTIMFNFSVCNLKSPAPSDLQELFVTILFGLLDQETEYSQPSYRALVALGNMIHSASIYATPLSPSQYSKLKEVLSELPMRFLGDPQSLAVKDLCGEIYAIPREE